MSANFARRSARGLTALVAALALGGTLSATARAAEPEPAAARAAEAADVGITAEVAEGQYLVGQTIPVEITVTNHGPVTATNVRVNNQAASGSYLSINGFGPLSGSPGASIPAGETLAVTVEARVYNWQGPPVARFTVSSDRDSSRLNNTFDVAVAMTAPDSGRGSISGLAYGDANGNGVADAGEGLQGVLVTLSNGSSVSPATRTGPDGRFRFGDLLLRTYGVFAHEAPDGWVLPTSPYVNVHGDEQVDYRAVRPVSDRLEASMAFTEDSYAVGQPAEVTVVLTNKGSSDIDGVKAGCDRSGEGPHVVGMVLGDLAWNAAGVTVAAGESRTFTFAGVVPAKAAGFASVSASCDFGPGDDPTGFPEAYALARVPGVGPGGTWGVLYHDRDEDMVADADELLAGVGVDAVDTITGRLAATTTTDFAGRLEFTDLPAGRYTVVLHGPWKVRHGMTGFVIGTCGLYCDGGWYTSVVPGPDVPAADPPAGVGSVATR